MLKRQHPTQAELFEYTESLLAKRIAFDSRVARHLTSCVPCRDEVDLIHNSLMVIRKADLLEAGKDLQASVLLAAKSGRRGIRISSVFPRTSLARGVALAACLLLTMSTILHSTRASDPVAEPVAPVALSDASEENRTVGFSLEALMRTTAEEELLGAALASPVWAPNSRWEQAQWRALTALEDDIDEALEALRNNPALLARAGAVVNSNRERKKETLKALYANRKL